MGFWSEVKKVGQKVVDFVKDSFTTPDSNEQQHVGWNIVLPTPTQADVNAAYASSKPTTTPTTTQTTSVPTNQTNVMAAYSTPTTYIPPANPANLDKPWERAGSFGNLYYPYIPGVVTGGGSTGGDEFTDTTVTDTGKETGGGGGEGDPKDEELAKIQAEIKALKEYLESFKKGSGYSSSGNAQAAYDAQLKAIEEQRAYAEKLAEQARQEAIKNAYINYDRSLSTYGQNAERLAQMGLTNSGYSDYLGGVAYSSMVGGVQDAHKTANEAIERAYYNASQQKAEAADALYNRRWSEQNEYYNRRYNSQLQAATKFEEILKDINYGEYTTAAQVQTLAKANGFTDDQTNVLVNALNDYLDYIDNANLNGNNENPLKTTVTRSTVGGTTIKETKTENTQSGGYTTVYEITDADGNTKTFATVKGH